ncbi:GntR family transcriptional regulator [Ramlibacter albus]|uniref:GntR family transcriptional regulator n=1 Tax=Ramlibacter albus TaxID=2079448 RepID=A0A923M5L1_9BURK|nr:GntR family transcriptional regulator [Ramlibacter albus]MBC5763333.1 GntR family transcriptional regulator [Ramlibacter albus]
MKFLTAQAKLVELVQDGVVAEIASGRFAPGVHIRQDQIAQDLGVSRAAVQEALEALRRRGVLRETANRTFEVAPLDLDHVRHVYDVRAVIEGLAFRKAAEVNPHGAASEGPLHIAAGRRAIERGDVADIIDADIAFHEFVYELSGNPLLAAAMDAHWTETQRVMGEVLLRDEAPSDVWDQHQAMLDAIVAGDGERAEALARRHIEQSAAYMIRRLRGGTA